MFRKFKNKLYALFLGSFTMVITACYGVPYEYHSVKIETVNSENKPIVGLKVSIYQIYNDTTSEFMEVDTSNNSGITNFKLAYHPDRSSNFTAKIEDIDSTENGVYTNKEIKLDENKNEYTIKMD